MNLYLISQDVNNDYGTYDLAVVTAESEEEARLIHPDVDYIYSKGANVWIDDSCGFTDGCDSWALPEHVSVKLIGETDNYNEPCVICSSFNAG